MWWLFRDIIVVVGLLVMVIISVIGFVGVGFDIREISKNIAIWGLTWLEVLFILLAISFLVVVTRLLKRLGQFERVRPELEVKPKSLTARELSLIVYNKGKSPASFEAVMTSFTVMYGELMKMKVENLKNASMVWETSGGAVEIINPNSSKVIKICRYEQQDNPQEGKTRFMNFYKVESSKTQTILCGEYMEGFPSPKAEIVIRFDSNLPINGQREWKYEIGYALPAPLLYIK
jgi:hypothetical protein